MKIALITDSTSYLTKEEVKDNNIIVVPIPVIVGDKEFKEGIDITADQLFRMQDAGAAFPKTSQPSMGEMISLFNRLHDEGYDAIITITLAGTISGFNQTLMNIARTNPEYNLYPYDSKITIRLMGYLVLAAAKMIKNGLSADEIITCLDKIRDSIDELFIVDDLNNLSRGGRLSNAGAFIGTMLHIKPLLTFDDETDKIVAFDKVRSMKRAVKKVESLTLERVNKLPFKKDLRFLVVHSNDATQAEEIKNWVNENFPENPVEVDEFGPVIGTHLGEKSIGITWMKDINKVKLDK